MNKKPKTSVDDVGKNILGQLANEFSKTEEFSLEACQEASTENHDVKLSKKKTLTNRVFLGISVVDLDLQFKGKIPRIKVGKLAIGYPTVVTLSICSLIIVFGKMLI